MLRVVGCVTDFEVDEVEPEPALRDTVLVPQLARTTAKPDKTNPLIAVNLLVRDILFAMVVKVSTTNYRIIKYVSTAKYSRTQITLHTLRT